MKCPFDGEPLPVPKPSITCGYCSRVFTAVEAGEVGKVDYLLAEMETWGELLPGGILSELRRRYTERKCRLLEHMQALAPEATDQSSPPS